jgi:hypothetical protein
MPSADSRQSVNTVMPDLIDVHPVWMSSKRGARKTKVELATAAVTVSGLQVLSTTGKSTDGTASHWKYVLDNVIVYRDVYRGLFF